MSKSLTRVVADEIVNRIASGHYAPEQMLPAEAELAAELGVSRLTLREAFKSLRSLGVLNVRRGLGTFVTPLSEWTGIAPVVSMLESRGEELNASVQILELRRMIEVGAARLAADRISAEELAGLDEFLTGMRRSHRVHRIDEFVTADLSFHAIILRASGNLLAPIVLNQLSSLLSSTRRETSSVSEIRSHAIDMHARIFEALREGDPAVAAAAMDEHMVQTLNDLHHYILRHESGEL